MKTPPENDEREDEEPEPTEDNSPTIEDHKEVADEAEEILTK